MFISAYLKTLHRLAPICLAVLVGVNIARFLTHGHAVNILWFILIQIFSIFVLGLLLTPIEHFKRSTHRD